MLLRNVVLFATIIVSCLPSVAEAQEELLRQLTLEGVADVRRGNWTRGINRLARAHNLALDAGAQTPLPPMKRIELSQEDLSFGAEQVRQMLKDRPAMAEGITEGDAIFTWAARQFAGETTGLRTIWLNKEPEGYEAMHTNPTTQYFGKIWIASRTETAGTRRLSTFDELWVRAVYELVSLSNAEQCTDAFQRLREGRISRDDYITEQFRLEFSATHETRAIYLGIFTDHLRQNEIQSDPDRWFFTELHFGDWYSALTYYPRGAEYPWRYFGADFDRIEVHRWLDAKIAEAKAQDEPIIPPSDFFVR